MARATGRNEECPYGADYCPKLEQAYKEIEQMKAVQRKMLVTLYFIAGVVSVTLGVQIL